MVDQMTDASIDDAAYRRSLAYDLLRERLSAGPMDYNDLLDEAVSFGLTRDDLFRARQSVGVITKHHKWALSRAIRVVPVSDRGVGAERSTPVSLRRSRGRVTPTWTRLV